MKLSNLFKTKNKESTTESPDVAIMPQVLSKTYSETMASWKSNRKNAKGQTRDSRYGHIAYSLMRGRSYLEIENKVREHNKPYVHLIEMQIQKYFPDVEIKWNDDKTEIILSGVEG